MRYLFKSPQKNNQVDYIVPQAKDRPQDYSQEYVNSQSISIEDAIAAQIKNLEANQRQSINFFETGRTVPGGGAGKKTFKERRFASRVETLKNLSESAIPSRAINILRGGIANLDFAIRPKDNSLKPSEIKEYEKSIATVRKVLQNPNGTDDDFNSFMGQIIEDIVVFDAGCWEYVEKPLYSNGILGLEVVPGYTISQAVGWSGDPEDYRWGQLSGGIVKVPLRDKDIEYIMSRKRSWGLYGYSNLEAAMEILEAWFNVSSFQRATASEAFPPFLVWLGDNMGQAEMNRMRTFWDQELKGRGTPGFWANTGKPEVIPMKPTADDGLFLKYTEMLIRVIAFCFNLKPQDFGIERDINRSQGEVSATASVNEAIKPPAMTIQARFNSKTLPRIAEVTGDEKIRNLEFYWLNIDPRDEKSESERIRELFKADLLKLDEARAEMDYPPMPNGIGQFTFSGYTDIVRFNPELSVDSETKKTLFPESTPATDATLEELREDAALSEEEKALKDVTEQILDSTKPDVAPE